MSIIITREQARRFLTTYHFTPGKIKDIFERLGTVQYDPLKPAGRNADLVLQARVPGYRIDDWQTLAYTERFIYDAWDKQACLVLSRDWPHRATTRAIYRAYHDREIAKTEAELTEQILTMIAREGPLTAQNFPELTTYVDNNTWYGQTNVKRILRSLWVSGDILTHHRRHGRHYYHIPAQVIPEEYYLQPEITNLDTYHRWILFRRYQAVGLLRSNAEAAIWSACGDSATRKAALAALLEENRLTAVQIEGIKSQYYMPTHLLPILEAPFPELPMLFIAPLDSFIWDRPAVRQIFDFDYIWEVYKPVSQRRWGYYVLPVFYQGRFVGRFDGQVENQIWQIRNWWWEEDINVDSTLLNALVEAAHSFLAYLGVEKLEVSSRVDIQTRRVLEAVHGKL